MFRHNLEIFLKMAAVAEQQTTDEVSLYDADTDDFYQDNTRI